MRTIEIDYPRLNQGQQPVQISLMDVRAANDIRVSFDFDRDGWLVEMPSIHEWVDDADFAKRGQGWKEVAFVRAWATDPDEA